MNTKLQAYSGLCRDESGEREPTGFLTANDVNSCYDTCLGIAGCTAFAFNYNKRGRNCHLFRGGPYTKGNGRAYTKCYVMPKGIFLYDRIEWHKIFVALTMSIIFVHFSECYTDKDCTGHSDKCTSNSCHCGSTAKCYGTTNTCTGGLCRCGENEECPEGKYCDLGECKGMRIIISKYTHTHIYIYICKLVSICLIKP